MQSYLTTTFPLYGLCCTPLVQHMSGDWSRDSACASAGVLHLGGGRSVLTKALLVRHCVCFVNIFIGFDLRIVVVVAAAAALPVVPVPPPAVAVVLPAPAQAHRNYALPHPPRGHGEAKSTPATTSVQQDKKPELKPGYEARRTASRVAASILHDRPTQSTGKWHVHRGGHTAQTMKQQDSVPSCWGEAGSCRQASEMTARTPRKERTNEQEPVRGLTNARACSADGPRHRRQPGPRVMQLLLTNSHEGRQGIPDILKSCLLYVWNTPGSDLPGGLQAGP